MPAVSVSRRVGWVTVSAVVLATFEAGWLLIGWTHAWRYPSIGWLPPPSMAVLTAYACWRVSRRTDLAPPTRRFWGRLGVSSAVLTLAQFSNMRDALGGPVPSQDISALTLGLLVTVVLIMMGALLRLPAWQRTTGDWARFALDAGVLMITSAGLLWHFSLRSGDLWSGQRQAVLLVCVLALVCLLATVKVTLAGVGQLDRPALLILSGGVALSAACGAMAPLLASRPYLSTGFLCGPVASLTAAIAAERQRRAPARPPARRGPGRRFSLLPYLAVIAMTATLLMDEVGTGGEPLIIASCVAALTALVVVRQVTALRDNSRLLDRMHDYQARLDHQVSHDALTGIANRSAFTAHVTAALEAGGGCHVALLDLDDFKVVNDRMGHGMGDALLRAMSHRLHERLRPGDLVARLGGDEFTLLLPGLDDERAGRLLREVAEAVQRPSRWTATTWPRGSASGSPRPATATRRRS